MKTKINNHMGMDTSMEIQIKTAGSSPIARCPHQNLWVNSCAKEGEHRCHYDQAFRPNQTQHTTAHLTSTKRSPTQPNTARNQTKMKLITKMQRKSQNGRAAPESSCEWERGGNVSECLKGNGSPLD